MSERIRGEVDFSKWNFGEEESLEFAEVIEEALRDEPPHLYFPISWMPEGDGRNGPAVDDPAIMYLCLDALHDSDDGPMFKFDLEEVIYYSIGFIHGGWDTDANGRMTETGRLIGEGVEIAAKMRDRLRKIADDLDQQIKRSETP